METIIRKTRLWFCEGTSDKVYVAYVIQTVDGNHEVRASWGRRGKTMQTQTKGRFATEWQAIKAYMVLVDSKIQKGYDVTERTAFC